MKARSAETKGVSESILRAAEKLKRNPVDPKAFLIQENVRRFVEVGVCAWCGAGPFELLANHVVRAHGIGRKELRDRAGLTYKTSITGPQTRAKNTARGKLQGMPKAALDGLSSWRDSGEKRTESDASKVLRRSLVQGIRKPGNSNLTESQKTQAVSRMHAARSATTHERDVKIRTLLDESNKPMKDIAKELGIHPKTLRDAMKRMGIKFDGRSRRDHAAERKARAVWPAPSR